MSACNFSFPLQGDPAAILQKARTAVTGQGGSFDGNEQSGQFNLTVFGSSIVGSYAVADNKMDIVISDKPFLLPCVTIEGFLKSQLGI